MMRRPLIASALVACGALVFQRDAYAYLDPGTWSYFLQLMAAVAIGALFSIKIFWRRIVAFCKGIFARGTKR